MKSLPVRWTSPSALLAVLCCLLAAPGMTADPAATTELRDTTAYSTDSSASSWRLKRLKLRLLPRHERPERPRLA